MAPSIRSWIVSALTLCAASHTATAHPRVTLRNGTYEGVRHPSFAQDMFLGIPYAQDTGGQNRFYIPQSLNESWTGVRTAHTYGPACPSHQVEADGALGMSEKCLSINIVRPSHIPNNITLPVVLWIHGGSYQVGTSSLPYYNLTYIVERSVQMGKPIVAASINYRKGGWGMLYSVEVQGSGQTNLSLRDMRKSLEWVRENIGAFGGDKEKVTIWGESAGSFAVGQLLMSYGGRHDNLFHRSIQESGSASTAWYNSTFWYQAIYDRLVTQTNCSSVPNTLACLRTVPYETLYPLLDSTQVGGPGFYPVVDGDIIPAYPTELLHSGRFAHVPHLYGSNTDEGTDNAPPGIINTDQDLYAYLLNATGFDFPPSVVREIMRLYPDDPALGIPLSTGSKRFAELGFQYKRAAAIIGDVFYHAPRLDDARWYSKFAPTYVYRFNTRPWQEGVDGSAGGLAPEWKGVQHFSETSFVFGNPRFVGPWGEYEALSRRMGEWWINFVVHGDPNGRDEGREIGSVCWPEYREGMGYGDGFERGENMGEGEVGIDLVIQAKGRSQNGSYAERDDWRLEGREFLTKWARRRHV